MEFFIINKMEDQIIQDIWSAHRADQRYKIFRIIAIQKILMIEW